MSARIVRMGSVESTMLEAAALAAAGCRHGTVVMAEEQTAGMGRHGHSWYSEQGAGLYLSLVLRLPLEPNKLPVLTLTLGLAAANAITRTTGVSCDLRWPNDVLIGDRKVAGILVQVVDGAAIAGIGINVNHQQFPPVIAEQATSLRLAAGSHVDREALLARLLPAVDEYCDVLIGQGIDVILNRFSAASTFARGKRVRVDLGDRMLEGTTAGLNEAGFLQVRQNDGSVFTVMAGGVRPV